MDEADDFRACELVRPPRVMKPVRHGLRDGWSFVISGTIRNMNIEDWWPKLEPATREWLIANNGDVITADIVGELTQAGRSASTDQLEDNEIDWIESIANDEEPAQ